LEIEGAPQTAARALSSLTCEPLAPPIALFTNPPD
jgi:hypothetical protein